MNGLITESFSVDPPAYLPVQVTPHFRSIKTWVAISGTTTKQTPAQIAFNRLYSNDIYVGAIKHDGSGWEKTPFLLSITYIEHKE